MTLKVTDKGVWLDGQKIEGCTEVEIKNLNRIKEPEVLLHIPVDAVEIDYHSWGTLRDEQLNQSIPITLDSQALFGAIRDKTLEA